ncbi:MAG: FecR family protein [Pseudobacter sp.]|uniref:FecR family protein n=1 Tax=Pseudobacter sp. TaxID=2045420 RepID=UPI003F7F0659
MQTDQLKILIERYLDESITATDKALLANMLNEEQHANAFRSILEEELRNGRFELEPDEAAGLAIREQVLQQMREGIDEPESESVPIVPLRRIRPWYWAAAGAIILAGAGMFYFSMDNKTEKAPAAAVAVDIPAGKEGAILTLADGSQLVLDSMKNGKIADQNGSSIHLSNGSMTYQAKEGADNKIVYNTMTTPKGRQFQFTLPDGTKIWLNAASSIRYPTTFKAKQRQVYISGEAYFDVAKDVSKPFIVSVDKQVEIQVLGTAFNINAYSNEGDIRTTLEDGMVKVKNISQGIPEAVNKELVLKPGQQAIVSTGNNSLSPAITLEQDADIEKITAWKKGIFNFEGLSLVQVMKELERWYDIDVVYEGKPPVIRFYGKMGKDLSLKDLLEALDKSKVKFELNGKTLTVKQ